MRLLSPRVLVALLFMGCAHSTPEERAAEQLRLQRCFTIDLIPEGVIPPRPYRVLGIVRVDSDGNPAHRDRTLQERACQLSADAVMDVRDERLPIDNEFRLPARNQEQLVTSTGTAIAYTDVTPPPPPAPPPAVSAPVEPRPVEPEPVASPPVEPPPQSPSP